MDPYLLSFTYLKSIYFHIRTHTHIHTHTFSLSLPPSECSCLYFLSLSLFFFSSLSLTRSHTRSLTLTLMKVVVDGNRINLEVLDTTGQKEFQAFRDVTIGYADGFLVVFSLTDPDSFEEAKALARDTLENFNKPIVMAGNKKVRAWVLMGRDSGRRCVCARDILRVQIMKVKGLCMIIKKRKTEIGPYSYFSFHTFSALYFPLCFCLCFCLSLLSLFCLPFSFVPLCLLSLSLFPPLSLSLPFSLSPL